MFEDQTIELLPERTTMQNAYWSFNQNGNVAIALALNVGNVNIGGDQTNVAVAAALAGSNVEAG